MGDLVAPQISVAATIAGFCTIDGNPVRPNALRHVALAAAPAITNATRPGGCGDSASGSGGGGYGGGRGGDKGGDKGGDGALDGGRHRKTHPFWNKRCESDMCDFHYSCWNCGTFNPRRRRLRSELWY
jgi:hypothetical protein